MNKSFRADEESCAAMLQHSAEACGGRYVLPVGPFDKLTWVGASGCELELWHEFFFFVFFNLQSYPTSLTQARFASLAMGHVVENVFHGTAMG